MVEQLLLALKVAFVVLLYLFVWRVIRVASRDIAVGQRIRQTLEHDNAAAFAATLMPIDESPGERDEDAGDVGQPIDDDVRVPASVSSTSRPAAITFAAHSLGLTFSQPDVSM